MYSKKNEKLDDIIENTIESISTSQVEIREISVFAKKEYMDLEDEFMRLKIEATNTIDKVDSLEVRLKESKEKLALVNRQFSEYSENEMKKVYNDTDQLRLDLAVEKEREMNLIKRRNELEIHLNSIRSISEKADKLTINFDMAYGVLTGDLQQITKKLDDMQNKEIWGIKVIEAQEIERKRIAREMHDGPAQNLSNLIIKTELCIKLLDKDIDRTKIELQTLREYIRDTIDETRRLIFNLRPMSIDDLGLIPSIERLIDKISTENDIHISLFYDFNFDYQFDSVITLAAYRIIQEAISNIIKYASATMISVELSIDNDRVFEISITDNGIGFNVEDVKLDLDSNKGFGISMMKERTNLLLGEFSIVSEVDKGSIIKSRIPLNFKEEK